MFSKCWRRGLCECWAELGLPWAHVLSGTGSVWASELWDPRKRQTGLRGWCGPPACS